MCRHGISGGRSIQIYRVNLSEADLNSADLSGVDLSDANLNSANLRNANLSDANLSDANLSGATLDGANLSGATSPMPTSAVPTSTVPTSVVPISPVPTSAVPTSTMPTLAVPTSTVADLTGATLSGADLDKAIVGYTSFGDVDLSVVKNLETVRHRGPSTIGIDTIYRSQGNIPEAFLRGAGVPDSFIELHAFARRQTPLTTIHALSAIRARIRRLLNGYMLICKAKVFAAGMRLMI